MKNPKECFSIVQNQTFIVLIELTRPECKDGSEPLTFHHETFSRFNFVIISADKKATTANIPVREIPGIFEKVHDLKMKHLLTARPVSEGASESPAYTTIINAGKLKGKTPAAALAEDGAKGESLLKSQVQWLKQNLAAYPRNAVQIQAIEALESTIGLEGLEPPLREAAEARLADKEGSLKELAGRLGVSKSCLNHRLRKLLKIAETIEGD